MAFFWNRIMLLISIVSKRPVWVIFTSYCVNLSTDFRGFLRVFPWETICQTKGHSLPLGHCTGFRGTFAVIML
jgi:hypothetical protein